MQRDVVLTPSPDVIVRELAGESVVLDLASGRYFGLNDVGTRVWQLIQEGQPIDEVIRSVTAEYDADPADVQRDVLALLEDLKNRGLVVAPPGERG